MQLGDLDRRGVGVWQCVVPLVALSALFAVGRSFLAAHGLRASGAGEMLWSLEFRLVLALWVRSDKLINGSSLPFDFEAFVFLVWPFVLPYYLYRTRGMRGALYMMAVYTLYVAPYVMAQIARAVG